MGQQQTWMGCKGTGLHPQQPPGIRVKWETRRQKLGNVHDSTERRGMWSSTAGCRLERAPLWCCSAYISEQLGEGLWMPSSLGNHVSFLAGMWPYQTGAQLRNSCPVSVGLSLCFPFQLIQICLDFLFSVSPVNPKPKIPCLPFLFNGSPLIIPLKLAFPTNVF